jgi:hypothetical protein
VYIYVINFFQGKAKLKILLSLFKELQGNIQQLFPNNWRKLEPLGEHVINAGLGEGHAFILL